MDRNYNLRSVRQSGIHWFKCMLMALFLCCAAGQVQAQETNWPEPGKYTEISIEQVVVTHNEDGSISSVVVKWNGKKEGSDTLKTYLMGYSAGEPHNSHFNIGDKILFELARKGLIRFTFFEFVEGSPRHPRLGEHPVERIPTKETGSRSTTHASAALL